MIKQKKIELNLIAIKALKWKMLLRKINATTKPKGGGEKPWLWKGEGVTIITANNIIAEKAKNTEKNCLGYTEIKGENDDIVDMVSDYIKRYKIQKILREHGKVNFNSVYIKTSNWKKLLKKIKLPIKPIENLMTNWYWNNYRISIYTEYNPYTREYFGYQKEKIKGKKNYLGYVRAKGDEKQLNIVDEFIRKYAIEYK